MQSPAAAVRPQGWWRKTIDIDERDAPKDVAAIMRAGSPEPGTDTSAAAGSKVPSGYDAADAFASKTDSELRRSAERYRAFAENSSEGIWLLELVQPVSTHLPPEDQVTGICQAGYLAECNDALARMYGLASARELIGSRLRDLDAPDAAARDTYLRAFVDSGYRLTDAESMEPDRDGRPRYFSVSLLGIVENGFLVRAWGTQRDITRQKLAEEALRERETRFRRLADAAPVLIWMTDPNGQGTYFNRGWLQFRGRTLAEEMGFGYADGVHPEDRPRLRRVAVRALRDLQSFTVEYRLLRRDGEYRWMLDRGVPLIEPDGAFTGYIGSCVDITDRKRAEAERAALHAQQRRFVREMLFGLTGGRLCLCDRSPDLPEPQGEPMTGEPILLSSTSLHVLRHVVRTASEAVGFAPERASDLLIAVGEAAMNAVVHAGGGEGRVYADRTTGSVQVWVTDQGQGIAEESLHRATLEQGYTTAGTLGHGFWMILRTVDRLWLLTGRNGTTVVLEQRRDAWQPPWMEGL